MCFYLRVKFQVSNIILRNFRQGVYLPTPTSKRTPKKPSQVRVNKNQNNYYDNIFLEKCFYQLAEK